MNRREQQVQNEDDLERELQNLRRRHEILRLRREIDQMERNEAVGNRVGAAPVAQANVRKIHFQEIEHAIVKFDGEDRTYSVNDFFRHMEQIFQQVNADELLKFLTLRNSLTGTARLLLTQGALTYDDLKANLIREFGRNVSRQEVYQALKNRSKKPNETVRRYVMEMESIARRGDVTDYELVAFIQEGLNRNISDFGMFNSAKSMEDIKTAVNLYEQRLAMRGVETKTEAKSELSGTKPKIVTAANKTYTTTSTEVPSEDRCYNCSRFGHRRTACPYEDRPKNVCFNCWKPDHDRKNCPGPKYFRKLKTNTTAALINSSTNWNDAEEFEKNAISSINLVSVAFTSDEINRYSEFTTRLSLFYTGSPTNLIQRSAVPFVVSEKLIETKYNGLGKTPINTYGKLKCKITQRRELSKCEYKQTLYRSRSHPIYLSKKVF